MADVSGSGLPEGDEKVRAVRRMFDSIAGRYDLVNRVITLGMDTAWRRRTVRALRLPAGTLVLDLACGTGALCNELQRSGYRAIGIDLSYGMLKAAKTRAPLLQADVLRLPMPDASVAGATCGFGLRNVTDLRALFDETARVVRPGGRVALLETSQPENRILRAGHGAYFHHIVPLIGGALARRDAYLYLPRSSAYLPPPHTIVAMLRHSGFPDAERLPLSGGVVQLLVGTRG
jgi:demethylmenaquinone methyltransferase/2-methoxy-6-polyprenyl-1,4-benzoquinol methylase